MKIHISDIVQIHMRSRRMRPSLSPPFPHPPLPTCRLDPDRALLGLVDVHQQCVQVETVRQDVVPGGLKAGEVSMGRQGGDQG